MYNIQTKQAASVVKHITKWTNLTQRAKSSTTELCSKISELRKNIFFLIHLFSNSVVDDLAINWNLSSNLLK